ncbi:MAG: BON domain-containing protein [Gemmataceae bacterium]|nr:BON domain-containing protein [Gemmataceae bacterium]MDW8265112.1 BON domain-containing protein [Gemmataceae bacterium]
MASPVTAPSCQVPVEYLESLISHRLGGRIRDLRVVVQPNGLVLHGRTQTYHAKQLAQHAAMEITGLPIVSNEIEVR